MRTIKRRDQKTTISANDFKKAIDKMKAIKPPNDFISSGCTTLNLALTQKTDGGWGRGRVANIVGDGSSGKTLLALEAAFWFFKNIKKVKSKVFPGVKEFQIVYNNGEGVMDFPIENMYGPEFNKKVIWIHSPNIENMGRDYLRRVNNLKKGQSLLYIVDSWDSMKSSKGMERVKTSIDKDEDIEGSFNLEKQKWASNDFFPVACTFMEDNQKDATLIIISQVRTKINITFGKQQYRAGGKALDFYTHQGAWIREVKRLEKNKLGASRVYGIRSHVKVERSKVAKPFRESEFIILFDYGLDDINSMIDFIWGTKDIKLNGKTFTQKQRQNFIKYIENNDLEEKLKEKTTQIWNEIEDAFKKEVENRKKRY